MPPKTAKLGRLQFLLVERHQHVLNPADNFLQAFDLLLQALFNALKLSNTIFQRIGRLMDAFDTFKTTL